MKKYVIIILVFSTLYSYSQGYTYRKSSVETEWILLGSLPKPVTNPHQKLRIKIFGGYTTNSSLGESIYTISTRGGVLVNMHREGGCHDESIYNFKIYESSNTIDFVLEIPNQWVIFHVESILVNSEVNEITLAQTIEIKKYNPEGKMDITSVHPIKIIMATDQKGNIGIGTETPKSILDVRGKIIANEVEIKVNTGADFVFSPDYNLKPLSEVEAFVKENKHLPEIPSEEKMQKDGVNVNELQIKLLQKIEELTLYVIQQDKKIKELEEKLTKE